MRTVPLQLQDGKWYVTRKGNTVQVHRRKSRNTDAAFPFEDGDSETYMANGKVYVYAESEDDIVRPAYVVGEVYMQRNGRSTTLTTDDNDDTYPLEDAVRSYTRDGYVLNEEDETSHDLMDYAPTKVAGIASPNIDEKSMDNNIQIGDRVSFDYSPELKGLTGTVKYIDGESCRNAAVELDNAHTITAFAPWNCHGYVSGSTGWFVPCAELTKLPEGWTMADTSTEATPPPASTKKLPREDRKLLWELYCAQNRLSGVTMGQLIALRRELDDACDR